MCIRDSLYPLSHFSELFGAAKSTLSEDVAIIKEAFERLQLGEIEVFMGASGGIKYIPRMDKPVSYTHLLGTQLEDIDAAEDREVFDEVLEKLNIDKSLLGKVYESCEVTGTVLPDIAEKTGLSTGTKVVGGAGDNAAAAVGTDVYKRQMIYLF